MCNCCQEDGTLCCCCCTCFATLKGVDGAEPEDVVKTKKRNLIWGIMYLVYGFLCLLCMVIPAGPLKMSHLDSAMAGMELLSKGGAAGAVGGLLTLSGLMCLFFFLSGFIMAFWYLAFGTVFLVVHFTAFGESLWACFDTGSAVVMPSAEPALAL